jgi:hypothetical protein
MPDGLLIISIRRGHLGETPPVFTSRAPFHRHPAALLLATTVHVSGPPPWCSSTQRLV